MRRLSDSGYTILEVMIVITISAVMFVVVAISFGGRQQQIQFTQSVRDFDSRLKDIMNDVSTGYYPENSAVTCTASLAGPVIDTGTAKALGSNDFCISIGKVVQFSPLNSGVNAENEQIISVFNVVGLRRDSNGNNPTTIQQALPAAIPAPSVSQLNWGLRVRKVVYEGSPTSTSSAIGFFSSLSRGNQFQSSASDEDVRVALLPGFAKNISEADARSEIKNIPAKINTMGMKIDNSSKVIVCLTNDSGDKNAAITLGGKSSGSDIDFDDNNLVVCGD